MTSDVRYREAGAPPREMSKRIAGLVRSFHNVPRLSVGLLAASCVCHALLLLLMTMHETGVRISPGHAEPFFLAVVSLGFSFAFLWVKTRSVFGDYRPARVPCLGPNRSCLLAARGAGL